jgi:hypothetical protein
MQESNVPESQFAQPILAHACAAALALAIAASLPQAAHAHELTPPPVPGEIQVPAGNRLFFEGHGVGTQNYICLPSATGFAWALFTPQAMLVNDHGRQLTTHFFSPNPAENGTVRATWQHSRDSSTVWAAVDGNPSVDPNFVAPGAIPWLRLRVMGAQEGPFWGDTLTPATFIQRVNTKGGSAPATGCAGPGDVGQKAFVPYQADYLFYTDRRNH